MKVTYDSKNHLSCIGLADSSHSWLLNSSIIKPRLFLRLCQLRCGLLPTKSRRARQVPDINPLCSNHCGKVETLSHILQVCHKTRDARRYRHNRVAVALMKDLQGPTKTVLYEPIIPTSTSFIKPDLIQIDGNSATVIDVSIVDPSCLASAFATKASKYGSGENAMRIEKYLQNRYPTVTKISHAPCIITYNGLIMAKSRKLLIPLGIRPYKLDRLCFIAACGSITIHDVFMR